MFGGALTFAYEVPVLDKVIARDPQEVSTLLFNIVSLNFIKQALPRYSQ